MIRVDGARINLAEWPAPPRQRSRYERATSVDLGRRVSTALCAVATHRRDARARLRGRLGRVARTARQRADDEVPREGQRVFWTIG
jgi:hypothetical protein